LDLNHALGQFFLIFDFDCLSRWRSDYRQKNAKRFAEKFENFQTLLQKNAKKAFLDVFLGVFCLV